MNKDTQAAAVAETPKVADPLSSAYDAWEAANPSDVLDEGETADSDAEEPEAEAGTSEDEESDEPAPELSQEAQDLAAALGDGPIGTDDLLRVLKDKNPKLEAYVRNLQANYTQSRQAAAKESPEIRALQAKVEALTARLEKQTTVPEEPSDDDDLGIDEDHMETFDKVARKLGFVKGEDLKAEATAKETAAQQTARQDLIRAANRQAVEAYGADFAVLDEKTGDIAIDERGIPKSPYAADLQAQMDLFSKRGVTWGDVYHLARAKDLAADAYERGKAEGIAEITGETAGRVRKRNGAATVSGSRTAAASPRIRFVPGKTSREDVEKQALAKGFAAAGLA